MVNNKWGYLSMRYHKMLDAAIKDSGMTLKEISEECSHRGCPIDTTSLSKMRKAEQSPPPEPGPRDTSKSKSRVLAEVLGISGDNFVLAGELEHTPLSVLEFLGGSMHLGHLEACSRFGETVDSALALVRDIEHRSGIRVSPQAEEDLTLKSRQLSVQLYGSTFFFDLVQEIYSAKTGRDLLMQGVADDEATISTLVNALADVARVPKRSLLAFVRALQLGTD